MLGGVVVEVQVPAPAPERKLRIKSTLTSLG